MSTAAELLDPEVFAAIKAEFHEVFVTKREEVRKLRAEMRASKLAHSGRHRHQAADEDGTLAGTKRSREGRERPSRPLKRPSINEDVPNTSPGATRAQCDRDLWENHTFLELSPTGALHIVCKVRVREKLYEPIRAWKEVERGMAAYEYVFAQDYDPYPQIVLIARMNAIEFVKLTVSGLVTSGTHCQIAMKCLPPKG
jgi:hypothetical protein